MISKRIEKILWILAFGTFTVTSSRLLGSPNIRTAIPLVINTSRVFGEVLFSKRIEYPISEDEFPTACGGSPSSLIHDEFTTGEQNRSS